jgi:hypothetical protein
MKKTELVEKEFEVEAETKLREINHCFVICLLLRNPLFHVKLILPHDLDIKALTK